MIEREKAIKSAENRRIEVPERRCELDYYVGDIVQLKAGGKFAGRTGVIIGIRAVDYDDGTEDLAYTIKLSDRKSVEVSAKRLRFLRHGDDKAAAPDLEKR